MCHDAACLGIPVDPLALYRERDPDALAFVSWVIEQVSNTKREENQRQKAEIDRAKRTR